MSFCACRCLNQNFACVSQLLPFVIFFHISRCVVVAYTSLQAPDLLLKGKIQVTSLDKSSLK